MEMETKMTNAGLTEDGTGKLMMTANFAFYSHVALVAYCLLLITCISGLPAKVFVKLTDLINCMNCGPCCLTIAMLIVIPINVFSNEVETCADRFDSNAD